MNDIKLGQLVRDTLTGFEGVAVARTEWLFGCVRVTVQPKALDDKGVPIQNQCFDEAQLDVAPPADSIGGDRDDSTAVSRNE